MVRLLLTHGAKVNQADYFGKSPLYIAANQGKEDIVALLLANGADVNQADKDGHSPLWVACNNGKEAAVVLLLDNGADTNQANKDGIKPIDTSGTKKIKDMLIAHTKKKQEEAGQATTADEKGVMNQQEKDRILAEFEKERLASVDAAETSRKQQKAKLTERLAGKKGEQLSQQEKDRILTEFEKESQAATELEESTKKQQQAKLAERLAAKKAKDGSPVPQIGQLTVRSFLHILNPYSKQL